MPSNHDLKQDVTIRDILFHLKKLTERLDALESKIPEVPPGGQRAKKPKPNKKK